MRQKAAQKGSLLSHWANMIPKNTSSSVACILMSLTVNLLNSTSYSIFYSLSNFILLFVPYKAIQTIAFVNLKTITMKQKILITKFNYSLSHSEFRDLLLLVAGDFANVPGCE